MKDTIYRQDAIDACLRVRELRAYDEIEEIKALPSAKKTGRWLSQVGGGYCCSKCGRYALHDVDEKFALFFTKSNYCPWCGTKMEVEE